MMHFGWMKSIVESEKTSRATRSRLNAMCFAAATLAAIVSFASPSLAQQPAATDPTKNDGAGKKAEEKVDPSSEALTSGLLELLNEPVRTEKSSAEKSSAEKMQPPALTPADVGLDGEDLGESSENPLNSVRQSMLIAAAYLRREGTSNETMRLQSDIVRRLDDLISQMESSQQKQQQSQSQQQADAAKSKSNSAQSSEQSKQSAAMQSRSGEREESKEGSQRSAREGEPENPPNQRGGSVTVDLSDPKSLQQDVWGQLPPRVRQQMQSRMVEQFLPAYREQIEAYFQALLK